MKRSNFRQKEVYDKTRHLLPFIFFVYNLIVVVDAIVLSWLVSVINLFFYYSFSASHFFNLAYYIECTPTLKVIRLNMFLISIKASPMKDEPQEYRMPVMVSPKVSCLFLCHTTLSVEKCSSRNI